MSAMDIIATQNKEGLFTCTPFYVVLRYHMFKQNPLERVSVTVNEVPRPEIQMYKDFTGEVFFVDDENAGASHHQRVPTQEHLNAMQLRPGTNSITFTSTCTLQTTTAKIFLWKLCEKIVVTDIDGTITKSDTRGLFYSRLGVQWHHNHVTDCFKKVYGLGYKIVYITARSITMELATRKYISDLGLPPGPLLLSPKSLVQAFTSEVISRDSKYAKMEHLSNIISLFPHGETPPIVAGFGNNENDEWAYRKSGIPQSHIFIVNKKSEILCNSGMTSYEVVSSEICKFFQSLVQDLKQDNK